MHGPRPPRWVAAAMIVVLVLLGAPATGSVPFGSGSSGTNRGDDARSAWYPSAMAPVPSAAASRYGTLFRADLGAKVYAQPVVAAGSLIVATEADEVAALDPVTGALRWQRTLGVPVQASADGCGDISPVRGVTSTPVVDPRSGDVFVVDEELQGGTTAFAMHRLDPSDGTDRPGFPVWIAGSADNQRSTTFDGAAEMQRPGLLLLGGVVYAAFASHCDQRPYDGWVAGVSRAGRLTTLFATEPGALGESGIWQSGGGLSSDGPGQILLTSGNGTGMPLGTPGHRSAHRLGSASLRLSVSPSGTLVATDFFEPYDQEFLSSVDADYGTGAMTVLPSTFGTPRLPDLAVTGSKAGWLYLLDRADLGGSGTGPDGGDRVVDRINLGAKIVSTPSISPGDGLLFVTTVGVGAVRQLVALRIDASGPTPQLRVVGTSTPDLSFGSSSPSISSRPGVPGSSLAWLVRCGIATDTLCADASLDVYQAAPVDGRLIELGSWPIPVGSKFAQPLIVGKTVYVATGTGVMAVGRLPDRPIAAATSLTADAAPIPTTGTSTGSLTITTATPATLSSVTFTSPAVSADAGAVAAAETTAATTISLPLAIDPTSLARQGEATSEATVTTSVGTIVVPLVVHLTSAGPLLMEARPAPLFSFGGIARGRTASMTGTLTNVGMAPLSITGVLAPARPFAVTTTALVGSVVAPGASLTYAVSASGAGRVGLRTSSATIETTGGSMIIHLDALVGGR